MSSNILWRMGATVILSFACRAGSPSSEFAALKAITPTNSQYTFAFIRGHQGYFIAPHLLCVISQDKGTNKIQAKYIYFDYDQFNATVQQLTSNSADLRFQSFECPPHILSLLKSIQLDLSYREAGDYHPIVDDGTERYFYIRSCCSDFFASESDGLSTNLVKIASVIEKNIPKPSKTK